MIRFTSLSVVAFLALAGGNLAQGALIVEFNFNDQNAVADTVHTNVTSSNFNNAAGATNVTFAASNASARGFGEANVTDATTNFDYWEFTVTANSGYALNLSNITFDDFRDIKGPENFQVEVNGTLLGELTSLTTVSNRNVNLAAFTGLSAATIRLIGYNDSSSGSNSDWILDNVQLNGAVVPEPSGLLLAGAVIPGLLMARRRKQRLIPENAVVAS